MAYPLTTPREALLAFAENLDDWAKTIADGADPARLQAFEDIAANARDWADDQRLEVPVLTKSSDGTALYWRPGIAAKEPAALLLISAAALDCKVDDLVIGRGGLTHGPAALPVAKEVK